MFCENGSLDGMTLIIPMYSWSRVRAEAGLPSRWGILTRYGEDEPREHKDPVYMLSE